MSEKITTPSPQIPSNIASKVININDLQLHYLEAGQGEVVLMLHGFPTSAYLYRNVMPEIAKTHRVIALDLPGFGQSDKSLSVSYSFNFYTNLLSSLLAQLDIQKINLVVHDLGGPIGLHWSVRHPEKLQRLVLLNTLVYPKFSAAVVAFMIALQMPLVKNWVTSASGIKAAMRFGVQNKHRIKEELLQQYQAPFKEKSARKALIQSTINLSIKGFQEIAEKLPQLTIPVRAIYGENDRILPKVADTMQRVKKDLSQTTITAIPNCGHFLQEDEPELLGQLLSDFLNEST